jgi:hypothetical protein
MWGLRVIRVGVLMCGLLALSAGSGCCECCQNLWKSDKPPAPQSSEKTSVSDADVKESQSRLPAERVHGGIY